jgi:site-specific recombinase XerD
MNMPKQNATHRTPQLSPYQLYLQTLSASGRKAIISLLTQSAKRLTNQSPDQFDWHQLKYANVVMLRNAFVQDGYAVATTNMMLSAIKSLMQTCFNMDLISADQLAKIKSVDRVHGTAQRKGRGLSKEEINALLKAAEDSEHSSKRLRDKAIIMVACGAGLRSFELAELTMDDIDTKNGILTVRKGKGRKVRQIHLAKPVLTSLKKWIAIRDQHEGALFSKIDRYGGIQQRHLSTSGIAHLFESLQQTANIDAFSPHDLRRTFITQLLNQGVDMNTVRQLAGHSDITTTARYDCRAESVGQKASKRLSFR